MNAQNTEPSSPESLRADVEALAQPGGRPVGSAGHLAAKNFLLARMHSLGLVPYRDERLDLAFEISKQTFTNLIGIIPGTGPTREPMLIGAHYDTCGAQPGADDNAAAVAIALGSVSALHERKLERDVIIAIYDSEEPPWFLSEQMGSTHFYHHQRTHQLHFSLVMDLVGHDVPISGFEDMLFLTGMESDPCLETIVQELRPQGIRITPTLTSYIGDLSDYHAARVARRPYLFLSCGHWEHYHEVTDTPEKLNYHKIHSILKLVVETLVAADQKSMAGPFEEYDTLATEIRFMEAAFGPLIAQLGMTLETRSDLDHLVKYLLNAGL